MLTKKREFNKTLLLISVLMVSIGLILTGFTFYLPSYFPNRDIFLLFSGFLLGFVNLVVDEYLVSSAERAESNEKNRILEKQLQEIVQNEKLTLKNTRWELELKQHDAVFIGFWVVMLVTKDPYDGTSTHDKMIFELTFRSAIDRLKIPNDIVDNFEQKLVEKKDPGLLVDSAYQFLNEVTYYTPEVKSLYSLSFLITLTCSISKDLYHDIIDKNGITDEDQENIQKIIRCIDTYIDRYEGSEGEFVEEISNVFSILTEKMKELKSLLVIGLQSKQSINVAKLFEVQDELSSMLIYTALNEKPKLKQK
jgi:hypothetical protein